MPTSPLSETSFSILSLSSRDRDDTSSDDEIVWAVSEVSLSNSEISLGSPYQESSLSGSLDEEDFVVLSQNGHPSSKTERPTPSARDRSLTPDSKVHEALSRRLGRIALDNDTSSADEALPFAQGKISPSQRRRRRKAAAKPPANGTPIDNAPSSPEPSSPRKSKRKYKNAKAASGPPASVGLGSRPIVDDVSELNSEYGDNGAVIQPRYEGAVRFIDAFLSDAMPKDKSSRLTLLQSLIVELGLSPETNILPASMRSATAFLKARAFLNIREYLAVRSQGQAALQKAMYPNRSALVKSIRRNHDATPVKFVKNAGLQVLLVTCYR